MAYKITVDEEVFELTEQDAQALDVKQTGSKNLHVLYRNASLSAKLLEADYSQKEFLVEIQGNSYPVTIQDEYDQLVDQMGLSKVNSQKLNDIKAPMPGLILDILVEPGQTIEKGTQLVILEAMKMENIIKAEGEGVVKDIVVAKGQAVEKGQIIIEISD